MAYSTVTGFHDKTKHPVLPSGQLVQLFVNNLYVTKRKVQVFLEFKLQFFVSVHSFFLSSVQIVSSSPVRGGGLLAGRSRRTELLLRCAAPGAPLLFQELGSSSAQLIFLPRSPFSSGLVTSQSVVHQQSHHVALPGALLERPAGLGLLAGRGAGGVGHELFAG